MSKKRFETLVLTMLAVVMIVAGTMGYAATPGDKLPAASAGAVNILNSAATLVFSSSTVLRSRNAFAVYNHGPNTVWCGWKNNVSNTTGFPITAEATLSVDLVFNAGDTVNFYCISDSADQTSPLNTRWIQVK